MNDQDFRDTVIDELATIKANTEHTSKDVEGIKKTLFGREGRTGVVADLEKLKQDQSRWNKGLVIFPVLLVGLKSLIGWTNQ